MDEARDKVPSPPTPEKNPSRWLQSRPTIEPGTSRLLIRVVPHWANFAPISIIYKLILKWNNVLCSIKYHRFKISHCGATVWARNRGAPLYYHLKQFLVRQNLFRSDKTSQIVWPNVRQSSDDLHLNCHIMWYFNSNPSNFSKLWYSCKNHELSLKVSSWLIHALLMNFLWLVSSWTVLKQKVLSV